jgi:hypothetical protein
MAKNISGIAIVIKAFLPTGSTIDESFAAFGMVKLAHESGDYSTLLAASNDVQIKTDVQTRRIADVIIPAPGIRTDAEIEAIEQARIDADYERGYNAGLEAAPIGADDSNIEAFNHGYAAGNAEGEKQGVPVAPPTSVNVLAADPFPPIDGAAPDFTAEAAKDKAKKKAA